MVAFGSRYVEFSRDSLDSEAEALIDMYVRSLFDDADVRAEEGRHIRSSDMLQFVLAALTRRYEAERSKVLSAKRSRLGRT
jgi:hypothetical protein